MRALKKKLADNVLPFEKPAQFSIECMPSVSIPANPPSEYWLCYIDPAGDSYKESPQAFGVEFKCLQV